MINIIKTRGGNTTLCTVGSTSNDQIVTKEGENMVLTKIMEGDTVDTPLLANPRFAWQLGWSQLAFNPYVGNFNLQQ